MYLTHFLSNMSPKTATSLETAPTEYLGPESMCFRPASPVSFTGGLLEDTSVSRANLGFLCEANDEKPRKSILSI